jgi:hypothetical protein
VDGWFIFGALVVGAAVLLVIRKILSWFALPLGAGLFAASILLPAGGADNPLPWIGALLGVALIFIGAVHALVRLRRRNDLMSCVDGSRVASGDLMF